MKQFVKRFASRWAMRNGAKAFRKGVKALKKKEVQIIQKRTRKLSFQPKQEPCCDDLQAVHWSKGKHKKAKKH